MGVDLGTINVIIYMDGQIVLQEPSMVALTIEDEKIVAIGQEARDMYGRHPEHIEVVRPLRREGRVLLEERARPGTDISDLGQDAAMTIAVDLGRRLWLPAIAPFRPITEHVPRWLANNPSPLTPLARELWSAFGPGVGWVVHGDFHHHNVLRHGDGYVAIDPKPYLADREYDVYTWLHNPLTYRMTRNDVERRIARFVAAGLDDFRIRAWSIVRGAYLTDDPEEQAILGSLLG